MGVFEMIVILTLIGTAGKIVQSALARAPRDAGAEDRIRALETELRANELRLTQAEERVAELGEKLDFVETLLTSPERMSQLPPAGGAATAPEPRGADPAASPGP